jgi:hypothetical protein
MTGETVSSEKPQSRAQRRTETYSRSQLDVIRAALAAHKAYTKAADGLPLNWEGIGHEIEDYTGVSIDHESLRQFVEGVSKKKNFFRQRVLRPERISAIVSYLTHPEIDALSLDELKEDKSMYQAPVRLLQFLYGSSRIQEAGLHPSLVGSYHAHEKWEDEEVYFGIEIKPVKEGVAQIEEMHESYDRRGSQFGGKIQRTVRRQSRGWCIAMPEGGLLFFMKNVAQDLCHCWVLAHEAWTSSRTVHLVLLRYDAPVPLEEPPQPAYFREDISERVLNRLFHFQK